MAPWSSTRINYLPMTMGVVFSAGLLICFIVAVLRGDVSPYMPFISETGGKFPEAGLFSMFLYLSSILGLSTMTVRYLIVDELNHGIDTRIDYLNRSSIVIGFIALMGMVVVAAYPMTSIPTAHNIGAYILFIGAVIYASLQTWLSYRMSPYYNGLVICRVRLAITLFSLFSLISMMIMAPFAIKQWTSGTHTHWTGGKTPSDQGFGLLVASSVAEWTMAISFLAYYFSFIREFGKVCIHLRVQVLVQHFDEDLPVTQTVNERTPIVMGQ